MDMAEDGMSKKVSSLLEKKDANANEDPTVISKEKDDTNTTMDQRETVVSGEPRKYMSKRRTTLSSKVKAALKKVGKVTKMENSDPGSIDYFYRASPKILRKGKPRKKRTTMHPIKASALKFRKDDDVDPADAGSACWS